MMDITPVRDGDCVASHRACGPPQIRAGFTHQLTRKVRFWFPDSRQVPDLPEGLSHRRGVHENGITLCEKCAQHVSRQSGNWQ
jgi:hypothetical protein